MIEDDLLELQIPPEAEFVGTARLFLAAAGRHFELSEEAVADAKVAVSEVCAGAIEDAKPPEHLRIAIRPGLDALEVEVVGVRTGIESDPPGAPPPRAPSFEEAMRGPLVLALFPDAAYEPAEHSLRLALPWELPEEPEEG